ncbi:cytochrome P450 [Irpex lacteus]|nr:cytochrome P450 [Irpex lacteus]
MVGIFVSELPPFIYVAGFVVLGLYIRSRLRYSAYDSIPAVGYSSPLLSYITAIQFYGNADKLIEEGHAKYRDKAFKIPFLDSWHIVISGSKLIDEIRQAKDGELSFSEAVAETMQQRYTMGEDTVVNAYHIAMVRNDLTKNINNILPDMHDELEQCFPEIVPMTDQWTAIPAMAKLSQIVARVSSRIFVGTPICRNQEYLDVSIAYTLKVAVGGRLLSMFPSWFRGIAAKVIASRKQSLAVVLKHVGPTIVQRRRNMELYGKDWVERPNDMLQWLLDSPDGQAESVPDMAQRLLSLNFASIHTTSMTLTTALYRLAASPAYIQPLREEAAAAISEEGWSKAGMQKMHKADSFIKECQRFHGFNSLTMERLALKDFTFKDGTVIPKGAFVSVAQRVTHLDPEYYENPSTFNPWRFVTTTEGESSSTPVKDLATTASMEYLPFGLGRHACPGRFFAVAELKALLAYIVLHYDIKMENEGVFPKPLYIQSKSPPNRSARVLFRRRRTQ